MARRPAHPPLDVFINGRRVGLLRRAASGAVDFRYAAEWLDWDASFPVSLSLPQREQRYSGAPVLAVFDNLLPDSNDVRRQIAARVGAAGEDAYSLLAALGRDCVGALQFLPEGSDPGPAGGVEGTPITEAEIADLLANLAQAPLGMGREEDFRLSLAGAQEKTALLRRDGQWLKPVGTTATTHILKPQIGRLASGIDLSDSVENEYLCLKLAEALGLPVAAAEMHDFAGRRTLVVERFDRQWTGNGRLLRRPQEDFCQALSVLPTQKYEADGGPGIARIAKLLKGSDEPQADVAAFMRANLVFWLLGATDGHAKNFSIFLMPGGRFRMTPLYDVVTTQPALDAGHITRRQFKLAMAVGRNRHYGVETILPRHFLETAELAGIGRPMLEALFEELATTAADRAATAAAELPPGFPARLVDSILAGIGSRACLLAARLG